ncbi:MAG: T9SS type A sorting domain-containing protein [Ignavibacteria bacterium]|nr:T9SS type A sorting domain-containing protein [Ignavibacteria bacterium]
MKKLLFVLMFLPVCLNAAASRSGVLNAGKPGEAKGIAYIFSAALDTNPAPAGTIILTSPAGGESWPGDTYQNVTWQSQNIDNVTISYSSDNGKTWEVASASTPAFHGSFLWAVPKYASTQYRIKVADAANDSVNVVSNTFSVYTLPAVSTSPASDVTGSSATFNGLVNANNSDVTAAFEYGTDTTYGLSVNAAQNPVNGATDVTVSAQAAGLLEGTTYHVRVRAQSAAGTVYGNDITFTTEKPSLTLLSPAGGELWLSGSAHDITWSSRNIKNVRISYSADNGQSWSIIISSLQASSGSYSWKVPDNLSSGYRVRISDASNSTLFSVSNSFTVYSLPSAQTNAASDVTVNSATLKGTVSAGNGATSVTFEYGTTASYGSTVNASPGSVDGTMQTDVSARLEGLLTGTTYHYRLKAESSAGVVYGSDRTFTTDAITLSLTSPSGGERWRAGVTRTIAWSGRNLSGVILEYSTDNGLNWNSINNGNPVTSGNSYPWRVPDVLSSEYVIRASEQSNPALNSVSGTFSVYSLPAAKTNNASDISVNSVKLNGSLSAGNSMTTVSFDYGTTSAYGNSISALESPVSGTGQTEVTAVLSGLKPATTYHFRIRAANEAGTVLGDDVTFIADSINLALSYPTGGEEWPAGSEQKITWTSRNVNFVMILYSLDGGKSWITLADAAPASEGSYQWKVPDSVSSSYKIKLIDAGNLFLSSSSGPFSVFTAPTAVSNAPSNITISSAVIRGSVMAGNSPATVAFEYGTTDAYGSRIVAQQNPVSGTSFVYVSAELTGLLPATTYHYRVSAQNPAGTSYGKDITFTTDSIKLAISAPVGGESWKAGSLQYITWSVKNLEDLKIDYSTDDGKSWITITPGTPSITGRYPWIVPNTLSSLYRIRISNAQDSLISYTSKAFSVYALPAVITSDASNITLNSAVLYASVNPGNVISTVIFEYGTSTAYGLTIPATPDTISGTSATDVSASINGLSQGNIYHFRVRANSSLGNFYGDDKTFTTDGITLTLTSPTGSEQWLTGTVQNISWRSKNVANIKIEYSTDNGSSWITIVPSVATSQRSYQWTVPSQVSSKYRVRITDVTNASLNAVSNSFLVYSTPSAVTKGATDITLSSAYLRGTVNAGSLPTQVSFEFGTTTSYGTVIKAQESPLYGAGDAEVSAQVSGLTAGTTYHYRVRAISLAGIAYGSDAAFTALKPELKLVSPTGGEEIVGSVQYVITWTSSNVSRISIEYSTDNGQNWQTIASDIQASQGSYVWNVPNDISSSSCMLRIRDNSSLTTDTVNKAFKIRTYAQAISLTDVVFAFSSPIQKSSYRMIGIPGESSSLKLSQYAQGEAKKDWTMYYDNGKDADYFVEYDGSSVFTFAPGRGFWIVSRNPVKLSGEVKTVALSSGGTYSIKLDHAGWNIITNPFEIPILWSNVQGLNSVTEKISGWSGSGFSDAQVMAPYEGYYFYNSRNLKELKLAYKPVLSGTASMALLSKKGSTEKGSNDNSSISFSLMDQDEVKSHVVAGIDKNSADDYDTLDAMAPPGDFEELGMRIIDNNISTGWKQLFTEFRSEVGEGQKFTLRVKNNTERVLKLKWEGTDNFKGYEVCLIDKRLSKAYDLRKETDLTLPSYAKLMDMDLLIGSSAYIKEESRKLMPQEYALFQNYPNPFNPATLIKYSLPQDAFVNIKVYDMLGRLVKDVVNSFSEAGYHEVSFDGSTFASGVYYYSMEAKGSDGNVRFREAKKMLLIK